MNLVFEIWNIYGKCLAIVLVPQDFAVAGQEQAYTFRVVTLWNSQ
jgi:hypothetical protein